MIGRTGKRTHIGVRAHARLVERIIRLTSYMIRLVERTTRLVDMVGPARVTHTHTHAH